MELILATTDGSEGSDRAIDYAAALALRHGASLHIVNVIGGYGLAEGIALDDGRNAWFEQVLERNSAAILQAGRDRARAAGLGPVVLESLRGDAASEILAYAEARDAAAIVVGKLGRGRVERLLIGSVAHKLVSLAGRVVMVVP